MVARDRPTAATSSHRSPRVSVTVADSTATSLPLPIAMPDVRGRQCGRVVDAVPDHRDQPLPLQPAHLRRLLVGQHVGEEAADARLLGDGACRRLLVTGEHHGLDAHVPQARDGVAGRRARLSAMPTTASSRPSTATWTVVRPAALRRSAPPSRPSASTPCAASQSRRPTCTRRPADDGRDTTARGGLEADPLRQARARTPLAHGAPPRAPRGCSRAATRRAAASRRTSRSSTLPGATTTSVTRASPIVSVPVLSSTMVSHARRVARARRRCGTGRPARRHGRCPPSPRSGWRGRARMGRRR